MFRLDNKVAVVIGGAGGIGEAVSLALAQQGAKVVIASRNLPKLEETAQRLQSESGSEAVAFQVDVTDEQLTVQLVEKVVSKFGTVDILVCSQGINTKKPVLEFPVSVWEELFDINVKGTMLACREFGKVMVEKKIGKIIIMSSVRGIRGTDGGNEGYCATKGAVDMIVRTLACEWAPHNINVNAIAPAVVKTPMMQNMPPERFEKFLSRVLIKRLGNPEDVAGACMYLASPASDWVTGQILYVDGGLTAIG
jgi:gluconate 5-dehydrogenase